MLRQHLQRIGEFLLLLLGVLERLLPLLRCSVLRGLGERVGGFHRRLLEHRQRVIGIARFFAAVLF